MNRPTQGPYECYWRDRAKEAEQKLYEVLAVLKERDQCEDCGGKGMTVMDIDGEAEFVPCTCSNHTDIILTKYGNHLRD